ncbi:MAG: SIR2 family protein [Bacteroidetes bacterium]|nr:SIR2 family protein [Bacteroidota bacterium]
MDKLDLNKELNELRNQLSYSKRMGFFLGSGTSKAIGISDIKTLTQKVKDKLSLDEKTIYEKLLIDLQEFAKPNTPNVEHVLNHLRLIRQITIDKEDKEFDSIKGSIAASLDKNICNNIYEIIIADEKKSDLKTTLKFSSWLNWLNRDFTKEIFTINYDLVFEKSFEKLKIPFFDGFIGADEPFFYPSSLETNNHLESPPRSWIRLWKLHGSLGWFWIKEGKSERIIRVSSSAKSSYPDNELVIYPSREKYDSSRKQPFIAYFDRLKYFLQNGEGLFIISGYSWSDEHINEIFYNGAKFNNRIHIICFFYDDKDLQKIVDSENMYMNITAYGPKKVIIGGNLYEWNEPMIDKDTPDLIKNFWDDSNKKLELGDFNKLVQFFLFCTGRKEMFDKGVSV